MGMHFGIVAARVPLQTLLPAFRAEGAELRPLQSLDSLDDAPEDRTLDYLIAGERAGSSYLIDSSMLLSAGHSDLLAAVARHTGALLVGCGAETVSGTFWFTAFAGPHPVRIFWMCRSDLAVPYTCGTPLPSEAAHPLDMGYDGDGIRAALGELGFDYDAWTAAGPFQLLSLDHISGPADQPFEADLRDHHARHKLSAPAHPAATVVKRTLLQRIADSFRGN